MEILSTTEGILRTKVTTALKDLNHFREKINAARVQEQMKIAEPIIAGVRVTQWKESEDETITGSILIELSTNFWITFTYQFCVSEYRDEFEESLDWISVRIRFEENHLINTVIAGAPGDDDLSKEELEKGLQGQPQILKQILYHFVPKDNQREDANIPELISRMTRFLLKEVKLSEEF